MIYHNNRLIYDLDAMTVIIGHKTLMSPSGHGCRMTSNRDAAFAMLAHVIGYHRARRFYWEFADLLTDKEIMGDEVIVMSEDEIKTWASGKAVEA